MSNLDELVQKNATRTQDLSLEVDHASNIVTQIEKFATNLSTKITKANQKNQAAFEALTTKISEAEQKIESETQTSKDNLNALQAKIIDVENQSEQTLHEVKSQLNEIKSRTDEILA